MINSKSFIFSLIISSAFLLSGYSQGVVLDQIIGVVGGKAIKLSDIENEYNQMLKGGYSADPSMKCDILSNQIKSKILLNQAMLDSVEVSDSQVESNLNNRLTQAINQFGSEQNIEKFYGKSMTEIKEDLRKSLKEMMLVSKMQENIVGDIEITPSDVKEFYNKLNKDSIPYINPQIELAQIGIYPPYSEQAILDVKDRLLDFRKQIVGGKSFAVLARLYSEDPGTAAKGGEYGFATKGELDPDFAKAAFALNSPGEVSRIVESQFGYHLIQLVERRGDRVNFRHILLKPKVASDISIKVKASLDSIANLVRTDSITFVKAVKYFSMDEDTRFSSGIVLNPSNGTTRFEMNQLTSADYYEVKNLKPGEISESYESRDSKGRIMYKIIMVKDIIPAHRANLQDDFPMLQNMAASNKKNAVLDEWLTDKRKSTFIQLDNAYINCPFTKEKWFKLQ
jgi:peptidyl-prolyl cis-trans isomerase SurA